MTPKQAKEKISDILFEYFTKENMRSGECEKKIMEVLDKIES